MSDRCAEPTPVCCSCIPGGIPMRTGMCIITALMLMVGIMHLYFLIALATFSGVSFIANMVIALMELVSGVLLILVVVTGSMRYRLLVFYLVGTLAVFEGLVLFLVIPIDLAMNGVPAGGALASEIGFAVYGVVTDIYFTFIIWSSIYFEENANTEVDAAELASKPALQEMA